MVNSQKQNGSMSGNFSSIKYTILWQTQESRHTGKKNLKFLQSEQFLAKISI